MYPPTAQPPPYGPPPFGPPPYGPPPRRRNRAGVIAACVAALVFLAIGITIYHEYRSSLGPSVATLQRFLDRVPVPPGAVLTDEEANAPGIDAQAYVARTYRLTTATPGDQVRSTLAAAHVRVVGRRSEPEAPVTATIWSTYAGPASGDVDLRPPGAPTGIMNLRWSGTMLIATVSGGDIG